MGAFDILWKDYIFGTDYILFALILVSSSSIIDESYV